MESSRLWARLLLEHPQVVWNTRMQLLQSDSLHSVFIQSCQDNWDWFSNSQKAHWKNTYQHSDTLQTCENQCVFSILSSNLSQICPVFSLQQYPLGQATTPLTSLTWTDLVPSSLFWHHFYTNVHVCSPYVSQSDFASGNLIMSSLA